MALKHAIERAFKKKEERGWAAWPKMYWLIDLHDVVIRSTYSHNNDTELYPYADHVLGWLSKRKDMCPILWSSSKPEDIQDILEWLEAKGIHIEYFNENPEVPSKGYLDTSKKPYFDILLDDKAGFNAEADWQEIIRVLHDLDIWDSPDTH